MLTPKPLISQLKPHSLVQLILKASICHKSELPPKNVTHWPYEKKPYNMFNFWMDPFTKKKFDENSKVIQIEGNIACGKNDFAQRLANELGMKLIPEIDLEKCFINTHGYDYRALNPLLPERLRACDWEMFHENPSRHSVVHLTRSVFKLRLYQYIKALQHLFNTGQGVILVRSPFTERVFVESMHNMGWLPLGYLRSDGVRFYDFKVRYDWMRNLALAPFLKPHLTIYLETPVETCMERIRSSKDSMIANSKALVPEFLEGIEQAYGDIVLPKQEHNGHLIKVDYSKRMEDAEIRDVIDDISELDFEYDVHDTRFEAWDTDRAFTFHHVFRKNLSNQDYITQLFAPLYLPWWDIAGLGDSISQVDLILRKSLFEGHVGPFGELQEYYSDAKVHGFLKALYNRKTYSQELDEQILCDFN